MFLQIEKTLVQNKCLILPTIYIMTDMDKVLLPKLKDIIKRHQGNITEDDEEATHIVHVLPTHTPTEGRPVTVQSVYMQPQKIKLNVVITCWESVF